MFIATCAICGEAVDRNAATTAHVSVLRGDQVPLTPGRPADAVMMTMHTRCLVEACHAQQRASLAEWPQ